MLLGEHMKSIHHARPLRTINDAYRERFGEKVYKIPLDGHFTCPNRDGTVAIGGCTFCSADGSSAFEGAKLHSLAAQFENAVSIMRKKWPNGKYLVYFQANTNTHAPVVHLQELFEEALKLDANIIGIAIATRPDCLPEDVLDYLENLSKRTYLSVELGLQTIHELTAKKLNRGHDTLSFTRAVQALRNRNIEVVAHIINGLPGETKEMMLETTQYLNRLDIQGIKIHMLYLASDTPLGRLYLKQPWDVLTLPEYVDIVCDQIESLRPDIIIHRVTGDGKKAELIAPLWTQKKFVIQNEIDKELRRRQSFQGAKYDSHF